MFHLYSFPASNHLSQPVTNYCAVETTTDTIEQYLKKYFNPSSLDRVTIIKKNLPTYADVCDFYKSMNVNDWQVGSQRAEEERTERDSIAAPNGSRFWDYSEPDYGTYYE